MSFRVKNRTISVLFVCKKGFSILAMSVLTRRIIIENDSVHIHLHRKIINFNTYIYFKILLLSFLNIVNWTWYHVSLVVIISFFYNIQTISSLIPFVSGSRYNLCYTGNCFHYKIWKFFQKNIPNNLKCNKSFQSHIYSTQCIAF